MTEEPAIARRVVVAFDSFCPDPGALRLALRLAAIDSQALHAVYVEDTDALTLGAYPWATEITLATAEARPLLTEAIERSYSSRAAEARSLFKAVAGDVAGARFETVRGRLADELRRIGSDATGVLLDWPIASRSSRHRSTMIVRALLDLPAAFTGFIQPRAAASATVIVLTADPSAASARSLLDRLVPSTGLRIALLQPPASAESVIQRARAERADILMVQRGAVTEDMDMLARLAVEWTGSLLLVR